MKIEQLNEKKDWNEYIASTPYGDILQTWEWGEIKKSELWQPIRLRVTQDDKIVGQALVLGRKLPLNFMLYYMPRGPVLDYASPQAEEILSTILNWIKQLAKTQNGLMIKIGPGVSVEQAPEVLEVFGKLGLVQSTHSIQMRYTRIIDLNPSDADILQSFDKDTRNLVRRAAREGVVVDHFDAKDEVKPLRTFHNMYVTTSERGSFPARPWNQMVKLWELMAPLGMAHIYTASFEEEPLASSLVLRCGDTAYQLWSGSRRDTGKKFATYALQWAIMQHMKQAGAKEYDMWGIAPTDDPKHPWAGPTHFKKGFKGKTVAYVGDYDLPLSPFYRLYILADTLRQKLFAR